MEKLLIEPYWELGQNTKSGIPWNIQSIALFFKTENNCIEFKTFFYLPQIH